MPSGIQNLAEASVDFIRDGVIMQTIGPDGMRYLPFLTALFFYLAAYVFMNLSAFAVVAFLRNSLGSEEIADYSGLIRTAPVTAVALAITRQPRRKGFQTTVAPLPFTT